MYLWPIVEIAGSLILTMFDSELLNLNLIKTKFYSDGTLVLVGDDSME